MSNQRDLFLPDSEPAPFEEQARFEGTVDPENIRL
jgi:hypothetical protein